MGTEEQENEASRKKHSPAFKAKVALAALQGENLKFNDCLEESPQGAPEVSEHQVARSIFCRASPGYEPTPASGYGGTPRYSRSAVY